MTPCHPDENEVGQSGQPSHLRRRPVSPRDCETSGENLQEVMAQLHWRELDDDGLWVTDLILASPDGCVLDMFSLTTSPWANGLSSCAVTVTVSNLAGSEILVLEAGSVLGPDETIVVGFLVQGFTELRRDGTDLVLVQNDDVPDKVYSTDGGSFIVSAQISVDGRIAETFLTPSDPSPTPS